MLNDDRVIYKRGNEIKHNIATTSTNVVHSDMSRGADGIELVDEWWVVDGRIRMGQRKTGLEGA